MCIFTQIFIHMKKRGWFAWTGLMVGLILSGSLFAQKKVPASYCLHPAEKQLADSINAIRLRNGKKALPLSVSLSYVARTHVTDLLIHHPDTGICNLSSWSNKGSWKPCCYNPYVLQHDGMWKKPQELTGYRYRGYEMVAYTQDNIIIDSVLSLWKDSPEAMNMMLTNGIWEKKSWACLGVGLNGHYASLWFGQRPDRAGKPKNCRSAAKSKIKPLTSHVFYLIYGSYPSMSSATKVSHHLKTKGYKKAGILRSHRHIRVYLFRSTDFQQVKKEKQRWLKKYPKMWILQQ